MPLFGKAHFIIDRYLSLAYIIQLGLEQFPLQGFEVIDEQFSVDMVVFVLDNPRAQPKKRLLLRLKMLIHVRQGYLFRTEYVLPYLGMLRQPSL